LTFQETAAGLTDERVPKIGMKFLLEEEAYSFYNKYAETIGFSIRRSSGHKVKNSSTMQQRTFTCSRQGISSMCFFMIATIF
jgi:zinc finger SWIM domain-containing protein 3